MSARRRVGCAVFMDGMFAAGATGHYGRREKISHRRPDTMSNPSSGRFDGQAGRSPGLKATVEVRRAREAESLQVGRGQARLVALVAHHDHLALEAANEGITGVRCRV